MVVWVWSAAKAQANVQKHKVSFELAERVFGDHLTATKPDPHPDGNRLNSVGRPSAASEVVLFVVHTDPVLLPDGQQQGRIISARRATAHERRAYEEGEF